ncbi:hypothetical protein NHH03_16065 [Stieleria sp. TO1_6]|uniref:hypothetical protein n=1 Tax=Stieleria tagensis TaxID=2956795 RepID=UPI00209A6F48|nr:hypothetical protein [Stieleria tagensis]MCO8123265.1 hypothetical protein [Stieleria tagensis]
MSYSRFLIAGLFGIVSSTTLSLVSAHEGHDHGHAHSHAAPSTETLVFMASEKESGNSFVANGKTYRWEHRAELGKQSEAMVAAAKGGLHNNADQDLTTNEIVTVVSGHGLVTLDPKLTAWTLVADQDEAFAGGMNAHGADCFVMDGKPYWAFASTNTGEIVVSERGKIVSRLSTPAGTEFNNPTVNQYFADGGKFTPCDVVYLPQAKSLVVVIGYTQGDFALSAQYVDGQWQWGGPAWGGKTNAGGPFSTAHGVQVISVDDKEVVEIASRGHARIYGYTDTGSMIRMPGADKQYYIELPERSNPCNLSHHGSQLFLPLLNPLPDTSGVAPVLVVKDGKPVGRLVPAEYSGLQYMRHMHGFCPVERDGKLFGVVLSWPNGGENQAGKRNDGQIAVFEAVEVQ